MRQQTINAASSHLSVRQAILAVHSSGSCQYDRLNPALSVPSQAFDHLITPLSGWGPIQEGVECRETRW